MFLVLLGVLSVLSLLYYLTNRNYGYWKKKNIPHLNPVPLLGNFRDHILLMKVNMGEIEQNICQNFPDEPLVGSYFGTEPCLIVQDPKYIKLVTTKDFYYFSNREVSDHVHKECLFNNLFTSYGDEWKVLRQNLTPMFTSSKMKNMFHLIEKCSRRYERLLDEETKNTNSFEIRTLMGRFTMDCIGSCAFGLDTRAMEEENRKSNPFTKIGDVFFEPSFLKSFLINVRAIWPGIFYSLGLKAFPRQVESFFNKLLVEVFRDREAKQLKRNDFIDLVLTFNRTKTISGDSMRNIKNGGKEKVNLNVNDNLLVAQCFVFFMAGYETSATTSSFTLYELAKHPEIQERARAEVNEYLQRHDGVLGYECVTELPYLEQCIDEALRLYPVLGVITREVVEPYTFPDTKLTVDKGMRIHLPVYHVHHNPKYFPNPEEFNPERFSPEGKKKIVPYSYFPFGEGPRVCIGMRFAKMQMLAGLVTVLKKYRVELAEDMPAKVEYEPKAPVTQSKHGIKLQITPRADQEPIMFSKDANFSVAC